MIAPLHLHSEPPGQLCGIISVYVTPLQTINVLKARKIFVGIDGDSLTYTLKIDHFKPPIRLFIYTHLLGNGLHRLDVMILDEKERVIAQGNLSLEISNFGHLAEQVTRSLQKNNVSFVTTSLCDSGYFDYTDQSLWPWYDKPNALDYLNQWIEQKQLNAVQADKLRQFVVDGFLVLEGLIPDSLLELCNSEIDDAVREKIQNYQYGSSQRIEHLHYHYPGFKSLFSLPELHQWLRLLFRAPSLPCQTLTYVFGSQQDAHQDTIHLTPFPSGYMCGVWIALQDVEPNSGELEIYRGSHRSQRIYMRDVGCSKVDGDWTEFGQKVVRRWDEILNSASFEKVIYRPKKGTVLIWHENLMHGGSMRIDQSLPRRSVVIHNFAAGCIAYYDSSGQPGFMAPEADLLQQ